jgi:hypothetical protein
VVESTALEMRRGRKFTVGSNPTLSASYPANNVGFLGFPELAFDFRPTSRPTLSQHRAPFRAVRRPPFGLCNALGGVVGMSCP